MSQPVRREDSSTSTQKSLPWYTISLFAVFVVPFMFLFKTILKTVQKAPFFICTGIVCVLGWGWSILLSAKGWWEFPVKFITGIYPLPKLPLEEFLIYPLGGMFSVFLYAWPTQKWGSKPKPAFYYAFIVLETLAFAVLAYIKRDTAPWYLYSQFVLYNGISLALAMFVAKDVSIPGFLASTVGLGIVGFIWDYFAFKYGWWIYHAITGVKILNIPVEDINFYMMAPTAAITLYLLLCRLFHRPQVPR